MPRCCRGVWMCVCVHTCVCVCVHPCVCHGMLAKRSVSLLLHLTLLLPSGSWCVGLMLASCSVSQFLPAVFFWHLYLKGRCCQFHSDLLVELSFLQPQWCLCCLWWKRFYFGGHPKFSICFDLFLWQPLITSHWHFPEWNLSDPQPFFSRSWSSLIWLNLTCNSPLVGWDINLAFLIWQLLFSITIHHL